MSTFEQVVEPYIITSHSIDGTFESCARRFEFLHVFMKAPEKESDAFAADVGTAIHEGTQEWQRRKFFGMEDSEARAIGEITLLKWWPWKTEARKIQTGGKIGLRTLGNTLLLLDAIYDSTFWDEWELVAIEGYGPAIEVPWRIIHKSVGTVRNPYGRDVHFATQGKIDFILRNKRTGRYRVIDIKSSEKSKPAVDAAFRFSGQAGQYGMVLNHAIGYDWQKEGLEVTYLLTLFNEDGPEVIPMTYQLPPEEVQDSIDIKLERVLEMKRYADRKHWPRRTHGCEFYGVPCGFLDVCHRRDEKFLKEWFEFEVASGRFGNYKRIYDPVWTLEA